MNISIVKFTVALVGVALLTSLMTACKGEKIIERIEVQKGSAIHSGSGVPSSNLGTLGDYYFDRLGLNLYGPKTNQGWGEAYNLRGQDGQPGRQGEPGRDGEPGRQGEPGRDGEPGRQGEPGRDGNTILSGVSAPDEQLGKEGDWYLQTSTQQFYGPKTSQGWGVPVDLLKKSKLEPTRFVVDGFELEHHVKENTYTLHAYVGQENSIDMNTHPALAERNITIIKQNAFANLENLTDIKVKPTVRTIEMNAFRACADLTTIELPQSLQELGVEVFLGCAKLANISISEENTSFSVLDNVLFDKSQRTLIKYPAAKTDTEYIVPATVQTIESGAFWFNYHLERLTMTSVKRAKDNAFGSLKKLRNIDLGSIEYLGSLVFSTCESLTEITLPASLKEIGNLPFVRCKDLTSIKVLANNPPKAGSPLLLPAFPPDESKPITIYVPKGRANSYKSAEGWSMVQDQIQELPN